MAEPVRNGFEPGRVISAAELERINVGHGQVRQLQSRGMANLEYVHDAAWQAGYRQGLDEAMVALAEFHETVAMHRGGDVSPVAELVMAVVRKILGDVEPGTLVAQIVDKAIDDCAERLDTVAVHVHPDAVAVVAERLEKRTDDDLRFDVIADEQLGATECELHSVFGIIEAGVDMQLDVLEHHFRGKGDG